MKALINTLGLILVASLTATAGADSLHGAVTMKVDLSAHGLMNEARLWVPYPISDKFQLITNIEVSGDFSEAAVYSDRVFEAPMLFARGDKGTRSRRLVFSFDVERQEVIRRDFPRAETKWAQYHESTKEEV